MRHRLLILAALLLAGPAWAQTAPPDPRLAGPTIAALQAMLALREAQIKAMTEDAQKRIAELEAQVEAAKPKDKAE